MRDILLILHDIRSAHNVGAIFRTADAFAIKKIYLTGYTPEPHDIFGKLRKDFAKTALGAEKFIKWEKIKNIGVLIKNLKKEPASPAGRKIFIASLEQSQNSVPLNRFAAMKPHPNPLLRKERGKEIITSLALILGNEVNGIPKSVLFKSDAVLEIPMLGRKESLNVSVAAGIALYALRFNEPT